MYKKCGVKYFTPHFLYILNSLCDGFINSYNPMPGKKLRQQEKAYAARD
jgi:hypothetical protein